MANQPRYPARVKEWRARRGEAFARSIALPALDLTGWTGRSQVRAYPDATTVLFDLVSRTDPIATTSPAGTAVRVVGAGTLGVYSLILLWIPQSAIDALEPFPANGTEPGGSLKKAWDCVLTPPSAAQGLPGCWFQADFYIDPGVTK